MIFSFIIKFIHLVVTTFIYTTPFFTSNKILLSFVILCNTIILTGWQLFDGCILSHYENFLDGSPNPKYIYCISDIFNYVFGHNKYDFPLLTVLPFSSTCLCLYKLHCSSPSENFIFESGNESYKKDVCMGS